MGKHVAPKRKARFVNETAPERVPTHRAAEPVVPLTSHVNRGDTGLDSWLSGLTPEDAKYLRKTGA